MISSLQFACLPMIVYCIGTFILCKTLILLEDLDSLALWEANWQMMFNVAKCHSMRGIWSDMAIFAQTNYSSLHTTPANLNYLGKRSLRNVPWYNNHREHGLGSTYL